MVTSFPEHWLDAFATVFALCKVSAKEHVIVLVETQSRSVNLTLAKEALESLGVQFDLISVQSKPYLSVPIIKSTGASNCLLNEKETLEALRASSFIVDLTVEGLIHSAETSTILQAGARILSISNEHPEILARLVPDLAIKEKVKFAVSKCRNSSEMYIHSKYGTDLNVNMTGAKTVGVWGWTDRPGTLAHWPAGLVVSFPMKGSVNGRLVFKAGDINLTFKRYFESEVVFEIVDDFVVKVVGENLDARLMRNYFEGFNDPIAYATSHVGWGLNESARYEALCMYDKSELNGTELRALAGNFLFSTGANEFANRFTEGHFDLPMMDCSIELDGNLVVDNGVVC